MKLTPWYPGHIKPVRVGAYDVGNDEKFFSPWFFWWDGDKWSGFGDSPEAAYKYANTSLVVDIRHQGTTPWRGIAKD